MRRGKVRQSAKFPGTIPGILTSPAALVGLVYSVTDRLVGVPAGNCGQQRDRW